MLNISFVENDDPREVLVFADGHANWDVMGSDIVCAAASVLLQTLWLGLHDVAHVEVHGGWSTGTFELRFDAELMARPDVDALVRTTGLALRNLAAQYPRNVKARLPAGW